MDPGSVTLLGLVGGALGATLLSGALFLLLLIVVASRVRFRAPRLEPLAGADSDRPAATSEAWAAHARLGATIQSLGWARFATLVDQRLLRRTRLEVQLFRRGDDPDAFMVVITRVTPGGTGPERASVDLQLATRYSDGSALVTTTSESTATLPTRPGVSLVRVPGLLEPEQLLAVHRLRRAREDGGRTPCQVPFAELAITLEGDLLEDILHAERTGLLVRDSDGTWRTTWRGALGLAWESWWPVSALRRARIQRQARALLAATA